MMRKKPMLAYPVNKKPIDYSEPVFMQPKLDGVRCVIQYENRPLKNVDDLSGKLTENVVVAYSRTGKEWKNINHILEQLKPFFNKYPYVILDGELYNHDFKDNFEQIISMVRKTKPTDEARAESAENVQFHCYDIIDEKLPFNQRIDFINSALMLTGDSIDIVDTHWLEQEIDTKIRHVINMDHGYEGSIVRTNEVYQCKRSHSLRKIKDFHDAEATITGWVEGKGKRIGTIGKFLAVDSEGNEFGMPVMDKFKYLQDNFVAMQGFVGQEATFTYFERTKANSYRHPLFKCVRNYE
jgi:DNA ligase-1